MSDGGIDARASPLRQWLTRGTALLLALVVIWSIAEVRAAPDGYPTGDGALIELNTLYATDGRAVLGPYSQFGWQHPGPLFFYVLAPIYALGRRHTVALNAGALVLNLTVLCVLVRAALAWTRPGLMLALAVGLAIFLLKFETLLDSTWNPHIIVLSAAALAVTAAVTAATGRLALPLVLLASFLVQTHLGTAPYVAAVVGGCAIWRLATWLRRRGAAAGTPLRLPRQALAAAALVWSPPLVEQLRGGGQGNVARILAYFDQYGTPHLSLARAAEIWSHAQGLMFAPGVAIPEGWPLTLETNRVGQATAIGAVVLLPVVAWRAARRGDSIHAALAVLCLLGSLATLLSVVRIPTEVGDYHVFWMSALGVVTLATVLAEPIDTVCDRLLRRATDGWRQGVAAVSAALLVAVAAIGGARSLRGTVLFTGVESRHPSQPARIHRDLTAFLENRGWQHPLVRSSNPSWGEAVGFVTRRLKEGRPVAVDPEWRSLVGPDAAATGREDALVIFSDDTPTAPAIGDPAAVLAVNRRVDHRRVMVYVRPIGR